MSSKLLVLAWPSLGCLSIWKSKLVDERALSILLFLSPVSFSNAFSAHSFICLSLTGQPFFLNNSLKLPPKFPCVCVCVRERQRRKQASAKQATRNVPFKNYLLTKQTRNEKMWATVFRSSRFLLHLNAWMHGTWNDLFVLRALPTNCFHNLLKVPCLPFALTIYAPHAFVLSKLMESIFLFKTIFSLNLQIL